MLLGEHAVLEGHLALAGAVDKRLQVTLEPRNDQRITIHSALGELASDLSDLSDLSDKNRFRFILAAVRAYSKELHCGFDVCVSSDFPDTVGFGSSAAVTVATHLVLRRLCDMAQDPRSLFLACLKTVRDVQGTGSGTDLAACIHGGVVAYRAEPFEWTPLSICHPITVVYSGHKTPTPDVIRFVQQEKERRPAEFFSIYKAIEQSVLAAVQAIRNHDWQRLGDLLNQNHHHMCSMGVSDDNLETIVNYLQQQPRILGAKISGSGLGDCAIGLGTANLSGLSFESIPTMFTNRGATLDQA